MLLLVRIAPLDARERRHRQAGLHAHHDGGVVLGGDRRITQEFEHFLNVLHITLASLFRFGVNFSVVIAIGKSEAALRDIHNDFIRIVRVLG